MGRYDNIKICVVGCGYVGLPLAVLLSEHFFVTAFDINENKIKQLKEGKDYTGDIGEKRLRECKATFSFDPTDIKNSDFIIVAVPTPITSANIPNLEFIRSSAELVGKNLKKGAVVVFESTVYPGVTEEVCAPIIENESGFKVGVDFKIGYSPERVNPGDKEHTIDKIIKIVSGCDEEALEKISFVYGKICKAGLHKASTIKTAEAAKVIENIQRDLNIALMNELQLIFDKMGIDTKDVLEAAGTKWNFHKYKPGLVGGHCIGVDPYYLTYKAQNIGYHPEVILAGRRINDNMHKFYAQKIIKRLIKDGKKISGARVLILGLTFKPNVNDARNSRVKNLIEELREYDIDVVGCDPLLEDSVVEKEFGVKNMILDNIQNIDFDLIVLAVTHDCFSNLNINKSLITFI